MDPAAVERRMVAAAGPDPKRAEWVFGSSEVKYYIFFILGLLFFWFKGISYEV